MKICQWACENFCSYRKSTNSYKFRNIVVQVSEVTYPNIVVHLEKSKNLSKTEHLTFTGKSMWQDEVLLTNSYIQQHRIQYCSSGQGVLTIKEKNRKEENNTFFKHFLLFPENLLR